MDRFPAWSGVQTKDRGWILTRNINVGRAYFVFQIKGNPNETVYLWWYVWDSDRCEMVEQKPCVFWQWKGARRFIREITKPKGVDHE